MASTIFISALFDAARLIEMYDIALRCGSITGLILSADATSAFVLERPVFPQRFEIFQHKIGMLCADVEFYCLNYVQSSYRLLHTPRFFHNQCLTDGCTSGIKHMNFQILIFFPVPGWLQALHCYKIR